jgi:7-cyano-7-deazaguanine synthase
MFFTRGSSIPVSKRKLKEELAEPGKAVVIMSGGLDSCGVAAYWKDKGLSLDLLTFNYGQRGSKELEAASAIGKKLGCREHKIIDISFMKELYGSSNVLTDASREMPSAFQSNIIVPIRNAVFLSIATARAFSIAATVVAYGAHLSDRPYPDCRPEFARSFALSLNLGDSDAIDSKQHPPITIWSPAVEGLTKDQMLAVSFRLLGESIYDTWSCYLSLDKQCGACESCKNRKHAFRLAGIPDKTEYLN